MELVKLLPVHRYSVDISYSGPSGILGFGGKNLPHKPVLGGMRIAALSISSHDRLNKNVSAVF